MRTQTLSPVVVAPQGEDETRERSRTRCTAILHGSYRAGCVTWDGVRLQAETWETQEALRAALYDLGIHVRVPAPG